MALTTECLRNALGERLGMVLTPELAVQIELLANDRADHSINLKQFLSYSHGELMFQAESFRFVLPELRSLHQAHFDETEKHLAGFELAPNYDGMAERERKGGLLQFTARDIRGRLVGNLRMYVMRSQHTDHLFAEEDTFFLLPAYRKGFTAMAFLRYAEECLTKQVGVREIRANTKIINAASKLMEFRGYKHVANQYVKLF